MTTIKELRQQYLAEQANIVYQQCWEDNAEDIAAFQAILNDIKTSEDVKQTLIQKGFYSTEREVHLVNILRSIFEEITRDFNNHFSSEGVIVDIETDDVMGGEITKVIIRLAIA